MLKSVGGSLVMLDLHTAQPRVMWNGTELLGIRRVYLRGDLHRVRITLKGTQQELYTSMRDAGIVIQERKK
jgi:hypothetical protein